MTVTGGGLSFTIQATGDAPDAGASVSKRFDLKNGGVVRIGRSPLAEMNIDHRGASQIHAEFRLLPGGQLCVRDLSSNGTGVKRLTEDAVECIKKETDHPTADGAVLMVPHRLKDNHTGRIWLKLKFHVSSKAGSKSNKAAKAATRGRSPQKQRSPSPEEDAEEDAEEGRKRFVELLLKTREISGSTTYEQAERLLNHEANWKACEASTRKECFGIFVEHLGNESSEKKQKKKGKDKEKQKGSKKKDGKKRVASNSPDGRRNGKKKGGRGRSASGSGRGRSRSPSGRPQKRRRR